MNYLTPPMDQRRPHEYGLEVLGDPSSIRDIVRGILHTIFFHRYFPPHQPSSLDILDFTLPLVKIPEIESLIDTRAGQLIRQLSTTSTPQASVKGQLTVQFYEKRRRKAVGGVTGLGGWFTGVSGLSRGGGGGVGGGGGGGGSGAGAEEEVCWETWKLDVTLLNPRTESERLKVMKRVADGLQRTAVKVVTIVNQEKDHIPPITARDENPFPFSINLAPRQETWGKGIGLF